MAQSERRRGHTLDIRKMDTLPATSLQLQAVGLMPIVSQPGQLQAPALAIPQPVQLQATTTMVQQPEQLQTADHIVLKTVELQATAPVLEQTVQPHNVPPIVQELIQQQTTVSYLPQTVELQEVAPVASQTDLQLQATEPHAPQTVHLQAVTSHGPQTVQMQAAGPGALQSVQLQAIESHVPRTVHLQSLTSHVPLTAQVRAAAPHGLQPLNSMPVEEQPNEVHITVMQKFPKTIQTLPAGSHIIYRTQVSGPYTSGKSNTVAARTLAPKPAQTCISTTQSSHTSPMLKASNSGIYQLPSFVQNFKPQSTPIHSVSPVVTTSSSVVATPRTKTVFLQSPRVLGPLGFPSSTTKGAVAYLSPGSNLKSTPSPPLKIQSRSSSTAFQQQPSSLLLTRKLPLQVGIGGTGSVSLKIANGKIQNEGQTSIKVLHEGAKPSLTPPPLLVPRDGYVEKQPPRMHHSLKRAVPRNWPEYIKAKKTMPTLPFLTHESRKPPPQPPLPPVSRKPNIMKSKGSRLPGTRPVNTLTGPTKSNNTSVKPVPSPLPSGGNESARDTCTISANKEPNNKASKQDLNRCLQEVVDSLFPRMSPGVSQKADANEVTLMKVPISTGKEEEKPVVLPEDDIRIELVPKRYEESCVSEELTNTKIKSEHPPIDNVSCLPEDELNDVVPQKSSEKSLDRAVAHQKSISATASTDVDLQKSEKICDDKSKLSTDSSDLSDKNAKAIVDWEGDLGAIPGIDLKFRMNEFGLLEMVDNDNGNKSCRDDAQGKEIKDMSNDSENPRKREREIIAIPSNSKEYSEKEKQMKSAKSDTTTSAGDQVKEEISDIRSDSKKPDEICCCNGCGVYGMQSEFSESGFCSEMCVEESKVKQEIEDKKTMDQLEQSIKRRRIRIQLSKKKEEKRRKAEKQVQNLLDTLEEVVSASHSETTEPPPSGPPSMSGEDVSNDGSHESGKPLLSWQKGKNGFLWAKYLEYYKVKPAPVKLFKNPFPFAKNGFKTGMKMEGIDPEHASLFCVLTVASVVGFRLKLHFDGYGDGYDFWVNANSADIFPPGWCEKNGRFIEPPPGYNRSNFQWTTYLKQCRLPAAPKGLFYNNKHDMPICPLAFRIGMKLEAVDRQNTALVCVATVADVLDSRILVHFDGWDDVYDYWADPSSSYIHPVGWCEENNHALTPPNDFKGEDFSWDAYLKTTKATAAPSRAFKPRFADGFKQGMRLECVDRRSPGVLRVATVDDVREHQIRVKFDGWTDIYSYWIDDDSQDIHPITWCSKAGHLLETPHTIEEQAAGVFCPTTDCKGQGHLIGSKTMKNHTVPNCPYDPQNLIAPTDIPDRLSPKARQRPSSVEKGSAEHKPRLGRPPKSCGTPTEPRNRPGRPSKYRRLDDGSKETNDDANWTKEGDENREKRRQRKAQKQAAIAKRNFEYDQVRRELHQAVMNPGYDPNPDNKASHLWAKHSHVLNSYINAADKAEFTSWSVDQVSTFVGSIPGCQLKNNVFLDNSIDGEAFSLMSQNDLLVKMGLKLGPAIKVFNSIVLLQQKVDKR